MSVQKPARYLGHEWNSVKKTVSDKTVRMAMCFPDVYEIGMSHLGIKILYHLINEREDTYCERAFMPWVDMMDKMKESGLPLFSLETRSPLSAFDLLGFTLQYELSYTNVLHMLAMGGIALKSADRKEEDPIVMAGGSCVYNIEPMADFFDLVFVGESENQINEFLDLYAKFKNEEAPFSADSKKEDLFLRATQEIAGIYVPSFYEPLYSGDGSLKGMKLLHEDIRPVITKALVENPDDIYSPEKLIVANIQTVHDRVAVELFRGCARGCRFCQAGFVTRPVRERDPEKLHDITVKSIAESGYEQVGLLSLSTGDYSGLEDLVKPLNLELEGSKVDISLPSLRLDSFNEGLMKDIAKDRKMSLTFAPEAGTQRLRDIINKNISEDDLFHSLEIAFNNNVNRIKLYFMMGLPGETMDDIRGIADLAHKIVRKYRELARAKPASEKPQRRSRLELVVSASIFVPKAFTPFQWEAQDHLDSLEEKQEILRELLKHPAIKFQWHGRESSLWEAVLSRGDRRLGKIMLAAYEKGKSFDSWEEFFDFNTYKDLMEQEGLDISFYIHRSRGYEEYLPWDIIDCGVSKNFLIDEHKKAMAGITTEECRLFCSSCGADSFGTGVCYE